MTATTDSVQQLYIAYFNRPADPIGLQYWADQLTAKTQTLESIANNFARQTEYSSNFTGFTSSQIVNTIYQNLFGHPADVEGLQYWATRLEAGTQTIGKIALSISLGALGTDLVAVQSKVQAATSFTAAIQQTTDNIVNYTGGALTAAKTFLSRVVDGTTLATETAPATLNATVTSVLSNGGSPGQTYALTTGIDTLTGTAGNDVFNATVGPTINGTSVLVSTTTLTGLDQIDGLGGRNTLNINDNNGTASSIGFSGVVTKNVQTITVRSVALGTLDLTASTASGLSGVTLLNTTSLSGSDIIKVGSGTAVNATNNSGGTVTVHGTDSAVTVSAAGAVIVDTGATTETVTAVGGVTLSGATGAVTAVDSAQGAANSSIVDGSSVSLTTAVALNGAANAVGNVGTTSTVTIGGASHLPTGAVNVTENLAGDKGANSFAGNIVVNGGSSVTVTQTVTQPLNTAPAAGASNTNYTTTQAAVTVNGSAATTNVTVNQAAAVPAVNTTTAQAGATTLDTVVFSNLGAGQTLAVGGLTFTAGSAGTTAAQTAAAFANLASGALQGASTLGVYSGAFTGWTTGAATGTTTANTVVFTSTTKNSTAPNGTLVFTGTGQTAPLTAAPNVSPTTLGAPATTAVAGVGGVATNAVVITDVNNASDTKLGVITDVKAVNYTTLTVNDSGLNNLSASNGGTINIHNNVGGGNIANKTLNLTLSGVNGLLADDGQITTWHITTGAAASTLTNINSQPATSVLNVDGSSNLTLTSITNSSGLKTVTVSGAAGLTADLSVLTAPTSISTAATTGASVLTLDATKATFTGGAGVDRITTSAGVTKAISLGDGNDSLTLAAGTTSVSAPVSGGNGTDTLTLTAADAQAITASASVASAFAGNVTGFEVLGLTGGAGTPIVHVDTLGGYNSVTTGAGTGALTLDGFTSGGTLTLTSAATGSYSVSSAAFATPTTDVFNIAVSASSGINAGSVTANKVETLNLSSVDTNTAHAAGTNTNTLTVAGDSVTKLVITGNANLNLLGANTTVTSVDASALTGGLTYTAAGTIAEVIKGGAGSNTLHASTGSVADTLIGGAGHDVLYANQGLSTLTGGGGADTFVITASLNSSSYSTITDATIGDSIQLGNGATGFGSIKISLAATAVFQDYVNAAVSSALAGGINWFQYSGDTYVVQNHGATNNESAFVNGTDFIVKLTGLVDLSHTSLNANGTLLIG